MEKGDESKKDGEYANPGGWDLEDPKSAGTRMNLHINPKINLNKLYQSPLIDLAVAMTFF